MLVEIVEEGGIPVAKCEWYAAAPYPGDRLTIVTYDDLEKAPGAGDWVVTSVEPAGAASTGVGAVVTRRGRGVAYVVSATRVVVRRPRRKSPPGA